MYTAGPYTPPHPPSGPSAQALQYLRADTVLSSTSLFGLDWVVF